MKHQDGPFFHLRVKERKNYSKTIVCYSNMLNVYIHELQETKSSHLQHRTYHSTTLTYFRNMWQTINCNFRQAEICGVLGSQVLHVLIARNERHITVTASL